jgi:hypothetical protein
MALLINNVHQAIRMLARATTASPARRASAEGFMRYEAFTSSGPMS